MLTGVVAWLLAWLATPIGFAVQMILSLFVFLFTS